MHFLLDIPATLLVSCQAYTPAQQMMPFFLSVPEWSHQCAFAAQAAQPCGIALLVREQDERSLLATYWAGVLNDCGNGSCAIAMEMKGEEGSCHAGEGGGAICKQCDVHWGSPDAALALPVRPEGCHQRCA